MGSPIRVLLVEDDADAATLTRILITQDQDERFRVEWTSDILSAVSRLAEPGIDVVLLDLGMPGLGVDETLPAIVTVVGKTIPIVILAADDSAVSLEIARFQGAANYLIKQQTSSLELRRTLYEAVVPATDSKLPFGWWVRDL